MIKDAVKFALERIDQQSLWDSLIVNKRKPYTFRAFSQDLDTGRRICLHRFEPCDYDDAFAHPHPWACQILVLSGRYRMWVGQSRDKEDDKPEKAIELLLTAGSTYSMRNRLTWHKVVPETVCYSLMVNEEPWDDPHSKAPTTKGKDLDQFTNAQLFEHLSIFKELLLEYQARNG